jgi:hypothetical protein
LGCEVAEEFGILNVLAQLGGLAGRHTPAEIATVLPALVLEVWAAAHHALAVGIRVFAVFLGKGSGLHGGDGGDLVHEGLPDLFGGLGWRFHRKQTCLAPRHCQA